MPVPHEIWPIWQGSERSQLPPAVQALQAPLLHTRFAPHGVPSARFPFAVQTDVPVEQDVVPLLHGFDGWQLIPSVQPLQVPLLHTLLFPHDVPSATLPLSVQTEVPVEQEVAPVLHGFDGWQLVPCVQLLQVPPLHTLLFPHDVPSVTFPLLTQTEVPVEQEVAPVLHGFDGWQLVPVVQAPQVPLSHTLLFPHDVPSATLPLSLQTEVPVEQEVVPTLHGFDGWQLVPVVQAPQVPLSHTLLFPHDVPSAMLPVSVQTDMPVAQEVAPVRQALLGWQLMPAVHEEQVPPLQTLFVPHEAPFVRFWPVSEQVIVGEQTVVPAWQALLGVQERPVVQATQAPALQTMLVAQVVPLATLPDSVQTGAPVLHAIEPVRQGLPETAQLAPVWQAAQLPEEPQTLLVPHAVPAATGVPLSLQTGVPLEQSSAPW
ncbi:MAG TPA: hypothetical protein VI456_15850 [Polyangia bacterium]